MLQRPTPLRICIVGCGAHAEQAYLPTLSRMREYCVESLIDVDLDRCRRLAEGYRIPHYSRSIDELPRHGRSRGRRFAELPASSNLLPASES
jgi:predicted dehydrogenase